MKKILAISDIHGYYDIFYELLQKVKYNPNEHQLILLGDYCDRGNKSKETITFIKQLAEDGAVVLRGNHEQMFIDFLDNFDTLMFHNGGIETLKSYYGDFNLTTEELQKVRQYILQEYKDHVDFIKSLPYYYETKKHLFVHAGIDPYLNSWKDMVLEDMLWIRDEFIYNDHKCDKIVVVGHTPTIKYKLDANPIFANKKILIDGGLGYNYQLNCLEIDESEEIYKIHNQKQTREII